MMINRDNFVMSDDVRPSTPSGALKGPSNQPIKLSDGGVRDVPVFRGRGGFGGLLGRVLDQYRDRLREEQDDQIDLSNDYIVPPTANEPVKAQAPVYTVQSKRDGESEIVREKRERAERELVSYLSREGVMKGFDSEPLLNRIRSTWDTASFGPRARPRPNRPRIPIGPRNRWLGYGRDGFDRRFGFGGRTTDNFYMRELR